MLYLRSLALYNRVGRRVFLSMWGVSVLGFFGFWGAGVGLECN